MNTSIEETYVYVVRMNVNADRRDEFDEWYVRLHGPDVVLKVPGFIEARSYRTSVGPQRVLSIYDITDPEILGTPEYHKMRADDPQGNDIRASGLSDSSLAIYSEVARSARSLSGGRLDLPRFTSPYVSTLRFDMPDDADVDAVTAWFGATGPNLEPASSVLASYLCRQSGQHPAAPSKEPSWIMITDWLAEDGGTSRVDDIVAEISEVAGPVSNATYDFGRRIYAYRGGI